MLGAFGRILYFGCIQDNSRLVCVDDAALGSLAKCLADSSRELHNDFRSSFVAGSCDCNRRSCKKFCCVSSQSSNSPFLHTNFTVPFSWIRPIAVAIVSVSFVFTRISESEFVAAFKLLKSEWDEIFYLSLP